MSLSLKEKILLELIIEGCCKEELYEIIIEETLGIPEDEVEGIDDRGKARFIFKIATNDRFEYTCANFIGRNLKR